MLKNFKLRSQKYDEMRELSLAGLSFEKVLEVSPWDESLKRKLSLGELTQVFARDHSLPAFDKTLILSFETLGRLPRAYELLSQYYHQAQKTRDHIAKAVSYPFFLLSSLLILGALPEVFSGKVSGQQLIFQNLLPLLLFLSFFWFLAIPYISNPLNLLSLKDRLPILSLIPIMKNFLLSIENSLFFLQASYLIESGLSLQSFFYQQGIWSLSSSLKKERSKFLSRYERGFEVDELFKSSRFFIPQTNMFLATAKQTGHLDQGFYKCYQLYQDFFSQRVDQFQKLLPKLIYFLILSFMAYQMISTFKGRLEEVDKALEEIEVTF